MQAAGLDRIEDPPHVYLRLTPDTDFREAAADLERAGERGLSQRKLGKGRSKETVRDLEPLLATWSFWAACHIGDTPQAKVEDPEGTEADHARRPNARTVTDLISMVSAVVAKQV